MEYVHDKLPVAVNKIVPKLKLLKHTHGFSNKSKADHKLCLLSANPHNHEFRGLKHKCNQMTWFCSVKSELR